VLEQLLVALKEIGYLILLILVFVQELGMPTVLNELIFYIFYAYVANFFYSIFLSILIGTSADFVCPLMFFSLFYFFCFCSLFFLKTFCSWLHSFYLTK
jgi:hypothetical protein